MSTNRGAYLMARLTTKGIRAGMVLGGKPELDRMDIAASCSKLPSLDFHLIMAKYCDDVKSALDAMGELQGVMCEKSRVFADMDPFKRTTFAAAIIEEFVSDRRCRGCKGTGQKVEGSKVVQCTSCNGTGVRQTSLRRRASACGIPESTYRGSGMDKEYQAIIDHLLDIEISALSRISRRAS